MQSCEPLRLDKSYFLYSPQFQVECGKCMAKGLQDYKYIKVKQLRERIQEDHQHFQEMVDANHLQVVKLFQQAIEVFQITYTNLNKSFTEDFKQMEEIEQKNINEQPKYPCPSKDDPITIFVKKYQYSFSDNGMPVNQAFQKLIQLQNKILKLLGPLIIYQGGKGDKNCK